ncbi:MAG: hypothetical protein AAGA70_02375 [Pseudomonadota bacterium]
MADGEEILWQGQPKGRILWADALQFRTLFGLVFACFAIFWIAGARNASSPDSPVIGLIGPLMAVPLVLVGLWIAGGWLFWDAFIRAGTHYTLTDRHAYIARHALGRRTMEAWPLAEIDRIWLEDGHPGAVRFEVTGDVRHARSRGAPIRLPFLPQQRAPLGFRDLDDPRRAHQLMLKAWQHSPEPDPETAP